jgi:peptidoglycan/xylan/chitin deacetylase (PgdA/CDA1 family)
MNPFINGLLGLAWQSRIARSLSGENPIALLYHGVSRITQPKTTDAAHFEEHVAMLKANFDILSPRDYYEYKPSRGRIGVMLTFDDGYRNNHAVVAPLLKKHKAAALFFVCKRPSVQGKYLWNTHLTMLRRWFPGKGFHFRGALRDMEGSAREATMRDISRELHALRPYPQAMYEAIEAELPPLESFLGPDEIADACQGLSEENIAEMSRDDLFSFGIHTLDHAILTKCAEQEAMRQMSEGRRWLQGITGKPCDTIAYPCGEYTPGILAQVRELGFTHGFAVIPALRADAALEEPRVGIYNPGLNSLGFKVVFGRSIRRLGLRVG